MFYIEWAYAVYKDKYIIKVENNVIRSDLLYIDGEEMPRDDGKALVERYDVIPGQVTSFYGYCTKDAENKKPPLGVMPCQIAAENRISDLTDGIKRQIKSEKPNYDLIKRWANEIENQCDVIEYDRSWDE